MDFTEHFSPMSNAALERYQRFNNPEPRDLHKIFGPVLATICNLAGVDQSRATALIDSWDPSAVTADTLSAAVTELTRPSMADMELARAKQAALEAEIAAQPLSARDRVIAERIATPLSERSRQSLLDEIYECNRGKTRDGVELRFARCGWGDPHYDALTQEIDRRDYEAETGLKYAPPAKDPGIAFIPGPRIG